MKKPSGDKHRKLVEDLELQTAQANATAAQANATAAQANAIAAVVALADTGGILDTQQAALYLGLRPQTLEVYRSQGIGPKCVFVSTRPRYSKKDLDAWIASDGRRKRVAS